MIISHLLEIVNADELKIRERNVDDRFSCDQIKKINIQLGDLKGGWF